MSPLELRTIIHTALNQKAGTQYGDILTAEPVSPVGGDPAVRLRVTALDPMGKPLVHMVEITEE